jgi:hypothetical protein
LRYAFDKIFLKDFEEISESEETSENEEISESEETSENEEISESREQKSRSINPISLAL